MKAKNCLIFGGSGQIGRNLIRKLTRENYKVTVVTRNIHQKSYIIKTQANAGYIDIVEANIFDEKKIRRRLSKSLGSEDWQSKTNAVRQRKKSKNYSLFSRRKN